jgi:CRISPR/Cas system-associated endoribonuclease Cas2
MLITYDVEARRTEKFRKLLVKYLTHEQYSGGGLN